MAKAPVSKTGERKLLQVRVLSPPPTGQAASHRLFSRVLRLILRRTGPLKPAPIVQRIERRFPEP